MFGVSTPKACANASAVRSQGKQWTTAVSLVSVAAAGVVLGLLVQVLPHESQMAAERQWVSLKAGVHRPGKWLPEVEVSSFYSQGKLR